MFGRRPKNLFFAISGFFLFWGLSLLHAAPPASRPASQDAQPSAAKMGKPDAERKMTVVGAPKADTKRKATVVRITPLRAQALSPALEEAKRGEKQAKQQKKEQGIVKLIAGQFREEYWSKGPLLALLLIFFAGFLVSLTPCVYPMIPVTIAIIGASGAKEEGSRVHAFMLSLMYVLGMAFPAVILGIVVASLGKLPMMMGAMMQSTAFMVFLTVLFLLMALSMFGGFDIALPSGIQTRLSQIQGRGYLGVFVLGMIGIVLSTPCSGPAMIGLLAFVAQTGSFFWGVILPGVMVLGIGVPFLLLGTGAVAALPRSGVWMVEVKKLFGLVFLGAALLYGRSLFVGQEALFAFILAAILLMLGVFSGAIRSFEKGGWWWDNLKQAFGIACLLLGSTLLVTTWLQEGYFLQEKPMLYKIRSHEIAIPSPLAPPAPQAAPHASSPTSAPSSRPAPLAVKTAAPPDPCLPPPNYPANQPFWITSEPQAIACAKRLKRPMILDFWATWCAACKQLEKESFSHPKAVEESRRFVMAKIDQTSSTPESERLEEKYQIQGLPWVRFLDRKGKLLNDPLIVGFVPADKLIAMMKKVQ
jgi:thiol:disulfide interchange protein DsbD